MPASMIRALTGSSVRVSGISTATPVLDPRPGSRPITVPTNTPMRHSSRFSGERAVWKPSRMLSTMDTSGSDAQQPGGQGNPQEQLEHEVDHQAGADRDQQ